MLSKRINQGRFVAIWERDIFEILPAALRDLLEGLTWFRVFHTKWTDAILDEMVRAIVRTRPDLEPERLQRRRNLMFEAVPRRNGELDQLRVLFLGWPSS